VSKLDRQEFRRVRIDGVIDGGHHPHPHQCLDHIRRALGHSVGELLNRQALRNDDVAKHLLRFHPLQLLL
jgi:hypothetical protein